jgi:CRISPR-associated RAMP protein (TIGR02581 family)
MEIRIIRIAETITGGADMLYTKFENKIKIKGTLTAVDPIHIGAASRESLNPVDVDSAVLKDIMGNPVIPGSSLKGVVRSSFEGILRAAGLRVCDIHNDKDSNCNSKQFIKDTKKQKLPLLKQAQIFYDQSCEACKLFGGRQFAGKLHFKDCNYIGDKPCIFEKRDGVGIDRETGAAARSVKYDFEIIPKGTKFDFELIAENLDEKQQKYLELILDLLCGNGITDGDYLAVGGKTTRGLGRIRLDITEKTTMTAEDYIKKIQNYLDPQEKEGAEKGASS